MTKSEGHKWLFLFGLDHPPRSLFRPGEQELPATRKEWGKRRNRIPGCGVANPACVQFR